MTEHHTLPSGRSQPPNQSHIRGGRRTLTEISPTSGPNPLVSVITVVRNGESTIVRCIESVLAQTYANTEHIIVDGGSSDQTVPILRSYGDKISLWVSEPDKGIYNALNKAIQLARGSHYIPLGCDDILLATGVESLALKAKTNLVICGKVRLIDADKTVKSMIYNHSAGVLIDISAHAELGLYDETYRIAADTKFLQLAARASYVHKIEEVVGEFVVGGASSNYAQNVREHSRAMQESGSWSTVKAFMWRTPRILWSKFRS